MNWDNDVFHKSYNIKRFLIKSSIKVINNLLIQDLIKPNREDNSEHLNKDKDTVIRRKVIIN